MKRSTKILIGIVIILILAFASFFIYVSDYYKAVNVNINDIQSSEINIIIEKNDYVVVKPRNSNKSIGLIFYPGGKVDHKAYLPLMSKIAKEGVTTIIVKMPFNLAVFDQDAADNVVKEFSHIENWYIGGHSLGGAMASSYLDDATHDCQGLILLGAYPVSKQELPTVIVYGSKDLVLDKTKISKSLNSYEIDGGNHAYFGNYGEQDGDGEAEISREKQQEITLGIIIEFINANSE